MILLVEDNPDDEALTLRALKKNNIMNEVVVAHDGVALDYLFGKGVYANRDMSVMPNLILLDLKLPKMDGLEVLRHLRCRRKDKNPSRRDSHFVQGGARLNQWLQLGCQQLCSETSRLFPIQ